MCKTGISFTCIGSFLEFNYPKSQIASWTKNGVFIDPRNNKPMEMDALSIFNMHQILAIDNKDEFLLPLLTRLKQCHCFGCHNSWEKQETHLRYSSAGIKLLTALVKKHTNNTFCLPLLIQAIKSHFSYTDKLENGIWFLHDSQELGLDYHDYHLKNNHWGSSQGNMLILNTHLESTNLLFGLVEAENTRIFGREDIRKLENYLSSGLDSLKTIIRTEKHSLLYYFDIFLMPFFTIHLKKNKAPKGLWHYYFYKFRIRLKAKHPIFFHKSGYIEREIGLAGVGLYYHVINLNDLAKLLLNLNNNNKWGDTAFISVLKSKIRKAISFVSNNGYFINYLVQNNKNILVEFCEAILITYSWEETLPSKWEQVYFKLRQLVYPTPGLKGSDISFNKAITYHYHQCTQSLIEDFDIFCPREGVLILVNYGAIPITLENVNFKQALKTIELNSYSFYKFQY